MRDSSGLKQSVTPIILLIVAGIYVTAGIFFLSPTFTGDAVGNLTSVDSGIVGAILFVFGIAVAYFGFKR